MAADLLVAPHFFDLLAPWDFKLVSGQTQKLNLDEAVRLSTCLPDGQDTMSPVSKLQALLRSQNLGSHLSCMEITVKAFFPQMLAPFSHACSPAQQVLQDPCHSLSPTEALRSVLGQMSAGRQLTAGSWPNSSGGRGDTI